MGRRDFLLSQRSFFYVSVMSGIYTAPIHAYRCEYCGFFLNAQNKDRRESPDSGLVRGLIRWNMPPNPTSYPVKHIRCKFCDKSWVYKFYDQWLEIEKVHVLRFECIPNKMEALKLIWNSTEAQFSLNFDQLKIETESHSTRRRELDMLISSWTQVATVLLYWSWNLGGKTRARHQRLVVCMIVLYERFVFPKPDAVHFLFLQTTSMHTADFFWVTLGFIIRLVWNPINIVEYIYSRMFW